MAYLLPTLLLALIPVGWLAVVLFGLTMCRLGARSDKDQAEALAAWIFATRLTERDAFDGDTAAAPQDAASEHYRAAG